MPQIFEMLDHDWRRLCRNRHAGARLPAARRLAGDAGGLAGLEAYVRSAAPDAADRVLLSLVGTVVGGAPPGAGTDTCHRTSTDPGSITAAGWGTDGPDDRELAARTLLQLLLPGTRRMARRWWALGNEDERSAAAVGAVYGRIRTYPLARRPGRVAANILMDAERELRRAVPSPLVEPHAEPYVTSGGGTETVASADLSSAAELSYVLKDAAETGLIDSGDARLIAGTRIAGRRVPEISQELGLRPRTVWDRRQRAERTLAGHYLAGTQA